VAESAEFIHEIVTPATVYRKAYDSGFEVEGRGYLNGLLATQPAGRIGAGCGAGLHALPTRTTPGTRGERW
jgi:hypothetical protein